MVKNQSQGIFMIGLLVVGAIGIIGWASPASPGTKNACDGVFRPGIGRCETGTKSTTFGIGSGGGGFSVSYSPVFSNAPFLTITPITASPIPSGAGNVADNELTLLSVETAGQTWNAFPVVNTELFGDTLAEHEGAIITGGFTQFYFEFVTTAAVLVTGNELLKPQYLDPSTLIWTDLSAGANNLYPVPGGLGNVPTIGTVETLPAGSISILAVDFRVVGTGGDGALDSITLTQVSIHFITQPLIPLRNTIQVIPSSRNVNGFSGSILFTIALSSSYTETFIWEAWSYTG